MWGGMNPPHLTDRSQLGRNRARAARAPALFLQQEALALVKERLQEVNRSFTAAALVTAAPGLWGPAFPGAKLVADEDLLDLEPGAHDLVLHALTLHWASDPVGQIIQARRALRPDGLFLAVLFGGGTLHELRASLAEAEVALTGGLSPRVAPMGEIRELGGLLGRAGLALPVADSLTLRVSYGSALALMRDLRAMGEGNALAARNRHPPPRALFESAEALYRRAYGTPDGRLPATFELIFLTGWAPDPGQARPLRPGSARMRLAQALGTLEHPAGNRGGD